MGKLYIKRQRLDYKNKTEVKDYLLRLLKYKRTRKPFSFYRNLCNLFYRYPKTITKIIENLHNFGYWKDYMYLLMACHDNPLLTDHIYCHLRTQFKKDVFCEKIARPVSRLAKWLPRQGSSFDRKCKFVTTFIDYLYPEREINNARALYRKTVAKLCKRLDVTEIKLTQNNYTDINFAHVGRLCFKFNYKRFLENCKDKLFSYLFRKYSEMNLWDFANEINREWSSMDSFKSEVFNRVWGDKTKEFLNDIRMIGNIDFIKDSVLVLDVTNKIFSRENMRILIGLTLMVSEFSRHDNCVFMNAKDLIPLNKANFCHQPVDRIKNMMDSICSYKDINYGAFDDKTNIIVLTDKEPTNIPDTKKIFYWQVSDEDVLDTTIEASTDLGNITVTSGCVSARMAKSNTDKLLTMFHEGGEFKEEERGTNWFLWGGLFATAITCSLV
jgi:hypothetical protein